MENRMFLCAFYCVFLLCAASVFSAESTYSMKFDGSDKWDKALYDYNIDVDSKPGSVQLIKTDLITDEMGNITDATYDVISGNVRAKKEIGIIDPSADTAVLILYTNAVPSGEFIIEVNGKANTVTFDDKRMLTGGWARADVDPKQLKKGLNTFVIYAKGNNSIDLYIDNGLYPNRSAKSIDAGVTWDYDHLGQQGFCDGEYLIRLRLSHYPQQGEVLSDFIDIGDMISQNPIKPVFTVKDVQIKADAVTPGKTSIDLYLRGGATPSYDPSSWDSWMLAVNYRSMKSAQHPWKFLQWKAVLKTDSAMQTPSLNAITVSAEIDVREKRGAAPVADLSKNREIIRGYYNYSYQPYGHERLEYLRKHFRLDEVVGGCSTEFEKFEVLATWLRGQWRDGWYGDRTKGLKTPWDAWIALNLNDDFKASGMCTIYANTYVQCCLAVGLNARGNVLNHHFVSEIWSNEYERWILFDIGFNAHSLRTVHMEMDNEMLSCVDILKAVNDGKLSRIKLVTPPLWKETWRGDQAQEAQLTDPKNWAARTGIPTRNNYIESWLPGELQHGFHQYSYDGYLWWKKTLIPEYEEYTYHTSHYRDMYWTINQIEVFLYESDSPGELNVVLDTVTPNLDKLMLRIDGGEWEQTQPEFAWRLKSGTNRMEVKPVNKWGLDGIVSEITVKK
ncbi:MAG: transglutaminase domain-containing protein [Candidatus Latescibacteria bacterium]|nr:transglutaminase domain-containing protein [Candidatus Latescibacterota bacterium]